MVEISYFLGSALRESRLKSVKIRLLNKFSPNGFFSSMTMAASPFP